MKLVKSCPEIVITGGPCSGKTTGMAYLKQELEDLGFMVFIIPEVATMYLPSIMNYGEMSIRDPKTYFEIQKLIVNTQMGLRHHFHNLASLFPDRKRVILSDRGIMDQMAYTPKRLHKKLLQETGLDIRTARDNYDAVMHLVTAAIGAEEFYTLENNTARTETPEQARILDPKTHNAWVGIEHLKVIDNSTPLKGKLKKLLQSIARALGFPVPLEIERKYLVKSLPNFKANNIHVQKVHIEQKYLVLKDGSHVRIRRRSQDGFDTFYKTIKIGEGLIRREISEIIDEKKYVELSQYQQKRTFTITKDRNCFLYNNQYFEFDKIHSPKKILFLERELTEENDKVELPPFIRVIKEVTDDPNYSNYAISKG